MPPVTRKTNAAAPARPASVQDRTTRDAILEAALDLFATDGYAGTSVRALARAVGVRESSLYNHFKSKEAILTALVSMHGPARSAQRLSSPQYKALAADPEAFCRTHAADVLRQWCDPLEQKFQDLLAVEKRRLQHERDLFAKAWFQDEAGLMADYFRGFSLRGLIHAPDARATARLFMAGLTFIRMEHFMMPAQPATEEKVRPIVDRYLANFFALVIPGRDAPAKRSKPGAKRAKSVK